MMQTLYLQREFMGLKVEIELDFIECTIDEDRFNLLHYCVTTIIDRFFGAKKIVGIVVLHSYAALPSYLAKKLYNYFQKIKTTENHFLHSEVRNMDVKAKITVWKNEKEYVTVSGTIL